MTFEEMTPEERQAVLDHLDNMWRQLEGIKQTLGELEAVANARDEAVQRISRTLDAVAVKAARS